MDTVKRQSSIDVLFNPRSFAVIGASNTRGKLGNDVMRNLIDSGFEGRIYPVNPKAGEGGRCQNNNWIELIES